MRIKKFEQFVNEAMATTAHIKVGAEYSIKSGIQDYPPYKVKVTKIVNDGYFVAETIEENKTTEYKGISKGDTHQYSVSTIVEESKEQMSPLNKTIEPKNDLGDKNPKAKEAFDKVVAWSKQKQMKSVDQSPEYGDNDIYIRLWESGILDVIVNISKEKELIELLNQLGGKLQKSHMEEETKGCRLGLSF